MNAPEKIYLQVNDDEDELYIKTTWAQDRINDKDIEYVRSDTIRNLGEAAIVTPVMRSLPSDAEIIKILYYEFEAHHLCGLEVEAFKIGFSKARQ